jgi:hypothetical protein
MSHDLEASFAAAEVASHWLSNPAECFATLPDPSKLSAWAAREGRNTWPHADGVIELGVAGGMNYSVAVEFKRPNEGLHGILTAIGQAHAYLRKGYAGSVIIIPTTYSGLSRSELYTREVLDLTSQSQAIAVYGYHPPDMSLPSPFAGRLLLGRGLSVDATPPIAAPVSLQRTETQWAHVREGSTEPDAIFKYLQAVKLLSGRNYSVPNYHIPTDIVSAINRVSPGADHEKYLSNSVGDSLADVAWRLFWFQRVLHAAAIEGWTKIGGSFQTNETPLDILRSDGKGQKKFFVGRSDSIKNKLVEDLNNGALVESDALEQLVVNYRNRAHSYREDIDSSAEHLGFVDSDGRLTDDGYKFVDACERTGDPNNGLPRALFLNALLREGGLGAFLHYVYRLSEEAFSADPFAFSSLKRGKAVVGIADYLQWVEGQMADRLHVIRKVSTRGGVSRKPFQAELALLRNFGIVGGFRPGVGLVINWPALQDALEFGHSVGRVQ